MKSNLDRTMDFKADKTIESEGIRPIGNNFQSFFLMWSGRIDPKDFLIETLGKVNVVTEAVDRVRNFIELELGDGIQDIEKVKEKINYLITKPCLASNDCKGERGTITIKHFLFECEKRKLFLVDTRM